MTKWRSPTSCAVEPDEFDAVWAVAAALRPAPTKSHPLDCHRRLRQDHRSGSRRRRPRRFPAQDTWRGRRNGPVLGLSGELGWKWSILTDRAGIFQDRTCESSASQAEDVMSFAGSRTLPASIEVTPPWAATLSGGKALQVARCPTYPATLLSMSSPVLGLRGEDSGHNNHEPLERRGHALTKSRVLVRVVPSRGSASRR